MEKKVRNQSGIIWKYRDENVVFTENLKWNMKITFNFAPALSIFFYYSTSIWMLWVFKYIHAGINLL